MDAVILTEVLPGIRQELTKLRVTKTELVGKYGIFLRFGGTRRGLFLSAHPELSRLGLCDRPPAIGEPRGAPDNLAEPLARATLVAIEQETNGRVARLRFETDEGKHRSPSLVAELIPRFANLILVGNDERILWTKREFGGDRPRQVAAGHVYESPAADPGVPFPDLDEETIRDRLEEGPLPRGWGGGANGPFRPAADRTSGRGWAHRPAPGGSGGDPRLDDRARGPAERDGQRLVHAA
jgi:predicted ribosome quality control (RQC) complex YloA/Tae2 family protein